MDFIIERREFNVISYQVTLHKRWHYNVIYIFSYMDTSGAKIIFPYGDTYFLNVDVKFHSFCFLIMFLQLRSYITGFTKYKPVNFILSVLLCYKQSTNRCHMMTVNICCSPKCLKLL